MSKKTYKEEFIAKNGAAAYKEKLAKNAAWRRANPNAMAQYAKERSTKKGSKSRTVSFVGDVHLGAGSVDPDKIRRLAKNYWYGHPVILNGDLCDLGLDRGMNWDNKYGPQQQIDLVEEIFKPLDVRAYSTGNHEDRIYAKVGLTPYRRIFGMDSSTNIEIGGRSIFFLHGRSAAENIFLEFQKLTKWVDSDVIALGHSHDLAYILFQRRTTRQYLVRTGSFLGQPRYVKKAGFAPKILGWVEYDTWANRIHLKAWNPETEEVSEI